MPTYDKNVFGALPGLESQPCFLTNQENQSIFAVLETANLNGTKESNAFFERWDQWFFDCGLTWISCGPDLWYTMLQSISTGYGRNFHCLWKRHFIEIYGAIVEQRFKENT